jgi:hypothetical protein
LRNITEYLLENGEVIKDGDTMEGVGVRWKFHHRKTSLMMPPRRTLRAFPEDGHEPPAILVVERENAPPAPSLTPDPGMPPVV